MATHAYTPDRRPTHLALAGVDRRRPAGVGETPTPSSAAEGVAERHPGGGETPSPLSRRMLFTLAASLPIAATIATAAHAGGYAPTLLTTITSPTVPDWQVAQKQAAKLTQEARQARQALETAIGPRGISLGAVTLPSGRTVPIQAVSPDQAKKLWRRLNLGPAMEPERAGVMAAVREACDRWDVEAERTGLRQLEQRATAARDRAKALMARASRQPAEAGSAA